MPAREPFDYAVVRVVPHVEREEFVNVGVVLHAPTSRFLACALGDADPAVLVRLRALAPDLDLAAVTRHLGAFRAVCNGEPTAGPIGTLPPSERFHWLVAPRSTIVQTSAVHGGVAADPRAALADLYGHLVRGG